MDPVVGAAIDTGTVAATLLLGLDHGADAMLRPLTEAVAADRPDDAMPGLVWVLVAQGPDGSLHGVLLAVPPTNVLADGIQGGIPVPAAVAGAVKITKVRAIAIAQDARGNRLAETLIKRTVGTYLHLGFRTNQRWAAARRASGRAPHSSLRRPELSWKHKQPRRT